MKPYASHERRKKSGSSNRHLPLIQKYIPIKNNQKQNTIKFDVPLELLNQYQKDGIITKKNRPRVISSNKSNKITSYRLRTNSMNRSITKDQHNKSSVDNQSNSNKNGMTIEHFNKRIASKEYIKRQVVKKNKAKKKGNGQSSQQKFHAKQKISTEKDQIFIDIKEIIGSKMINKKTKEDQQTANLNHVQQLLKLVQINKSLRKLSPKKSIGELKKSIEDEGKQAIPLKDESNYHEWRRVDLNSTHTKPRYTQSTFDIENQRLSEFVAKNSVSLLNYLQLRNQLHIFKQSKSLKSQVL